MISTRALPAQELERRLAGTVAGKRQCKAQLAEGVHPHSHFLVLPVLVYIACMMKHILLSLVKDICR